MTTPRTPNNRTCQGASGNAFVIVLVGVVLFAALMFTFSRSARQGGDNLSDRNADLYAAEILTYAQKVERGVNRLLARNCSENDLNFGNVVFKRVDGASIQPDGHNPNSSAAACSLYKPEGGSVTPQTVAADATVSVTGSWGAAWPASGHWVVQEAILQDVGSAAPDLVLALAGVKKDVCIKLNEKLGVTNPSGLPPGDDPTNSQNFDGDFDATGIIGDDAAELAGQRIFCFQNEDALPVVIYELRTVLIER